MNSRVLLVTTGDTEREMLLAAARDAGMTLREEKGEGQIYDHLGAVGGVDVIAVNLRAMGPFGPAGSAACCIHAQIETRAVHLLLVGTAFGVDPRRQSIGDVAVSSAVLFYDRIDVTENEQGTPIIQFAEDALMPANHTLVERFRRLQRGELCGDVQRILPGVILSGGARIESEAFRDELVYRAMRDTRVQSGGPVVAGEMEGAGLVAAEPSVGPNWIIVKGIMDFADPASRDRPTRNANRKIAARSAAVLALRAISHMSEGVVR